MALLSYFVLIVPAVSSQVFVLDVFPITTFSASVTYFLSVTSDISQVSSTTSHVFVFTESTAHVPHAIGMSQLHKRLFPFTVLILAPETSVSCFVSMLF